MKQLKLADFKAWGSQGGKARARRLTKARRRQIARIAGSTPKNNRTLESPADLVRRHAICEMFRSGKTMAEIGDIYEISRERVRQLLAKSGLTKNDGGKRIWMFLNTETRIKKERERLEKLDRRKMELWGISKEKYDSIVMEYGNSHSGKSPFRCYVNQRKNAMNRGIQWAISFAEWWQYWLDSGHWKQRGKGKHQYCMARIGDSGPYKIGNVEIITSSQNHIDSFLIHPGKQRWEKSKSSKKVKQESEKEKTPS